MNQATRDAVYALRPHRFLCMIMLLTALGPVTRVLAGISRGGPPTFHPHVFGVSTWVAIWIACDFAAEFRCGKWPGLRRFLWLWAASALTIFGVLFLAAFVPQTLRGYLFSLEFPEMRWGSIALAIHCGSYRYVLMPAACMAASAPLVLWAVLAGLGTERNKGRTILLAGICLAAFELLVDRVLWPKHSLIPPERWDWVVLPDAPIHALPRIGPPTSLAPILHLPLVLTALCSIAAARRFRSGTPQQASSASRRTVSWLRVHGSLCAAAAAWFLLLLSLRTRFLFIPALPFIELVKWLSHVSEQEFSPEGHGIDMLTISGIPVTCVLAGVVGYWLTALADKLVRRIPFGTGAVFVIIAALPVCSAAVWAKQHATKRSENLSLERKHRRLQREQAVAWHYGFELPTRKTEASLPHVLGPLLFPQSQLAEWASLPRASLRSGGLPAAPNAWHIDLVTDRPTSEVLAFYRVYHPDGASVRAEALTPRKTKMLRPVEELWHSFDDCLMSDGRTVHLIIRANDTITTMSFDTTKPWGGISSTDNSRLSETTVPLLSETETLDSPVVQEYLRKLEEAHKDKQTKRKLRFGGIPGLH